MNKIISIISMAFVCLVISIPAVHAEESFEGIGCFAGEPKPFHKSKDLPPVYRWQGNGIFMSKAANKFFDSGTLHTEILVYGAGEKAVTAYLSKWTDPEGDMIIAAGYWTGTVPKAKFVEGTGKYKGITGSLTWKLITRGKPAMPGTFQGCWTVTGSFELSRK